MPVRDFNIFASMRAWKSQGEHELRIGGVCSSDCLDRQAEVVVQDGLDFSRFLSYGWFNDNHGQKATDVRGYPTGVKRVRKGEKLPDGSTSKVNGWWTEGYLIPTEEGKRLHETVTALEGSARGMGFSIEGKIRQRNGSKVVAADVTNVAITHVPVNPDTHMVSLSKALMAGSGVASPEVSGGSPGDAGPLRAESLEGGLRPSNQQGKDDEEDEDDLVKRTAEVPIVVKSEATIPSALPVITDRHHVESWADSLQYGVENMGDPEQATLSKAEAAIVARHLPGYDVADLFTGELR